ncbi:MAG: membrane protein insertase YidC [Planctomycetes bacterium]|nr:membrane protein insertase YidC [Planctomycetota bacterium]
MRNRTLLIVFLAGFVCLCGYFVMDSGLFDNTGDTSRMVSLAVGEGDDEAASKPSTDAPAVIKAVVDPTFKGYGVGHAQPESVSVVLGSDQEGSDFKFAVELTSKGAAIKQATLSEWKDRNPEEQKPLAVLSPVEHKGGDVYSLSNGKLRIDGHQLPLSKLQWKMGEVVKGDAGSESVSFEAVIYKKFETQDGSKTETNALKLVKTYSVTPGSYDVKISLVVENLDDKGVKATMELQGPTGISREGSRQDMRSVVSGFLAGDTVESSKRDQRRLRAAMKAGAKAKAKEKLDLSLKKKTGRFLWSSITNKYFAVIVRPVPAKDEEFTDVKLGKAQYFDPVSFEGKADGDEDISFGMTVEPGEIAAGGSVSYDFEIFVGPKIKKLFEDNATYKKLGYIQTVSFMACFCCPDAIINPLSFGIMALMKGMHTYLHINYGIVIIIFVLLIRFVLHPITKKSQVSMMKMQKITGDPEMVAIKKKYAGNRQELQKATMQFYRDRNVSPASGMFSMIPMMLQMPIWISLYRAIYANIELRGAGFLPVWITDLSVPDALIPFSDPIVIPLVGWHIDSFNLLPILLGVAMFLQQKLMPHQSGKNVDPQVAQQQKMMMIMMPFMMLIFLYTAPSGLNLYIMASTFGGVFEQTVIRKHLREKEEEESQGLVAVTKKTGGKKKKKKPKPLYKQ